MKKTILTQHERDQLSRFIERTNSFANAFNRYSEYLNSANLDTNEFIDPCTWLNASKGDFIEINDNEVKPWAFRAIMRAKLALALDEFNTQTKGLYAYAVPENDLDFRDIYDTEAGRGYWALGVRIERESDMMGIYAQFSTMGGEENAENAKFSVIWSNNDRVNKSLSFCAPFIREAIIELCGPEPEPQRNYVVRGTVEQEYCLIIKASNREEAKEKASDVSTDKWIKNGSSGLNIYDADVE